MVWRSLALFLQFLISRLMRSTIASIIIAGLVIAGTIFLAGKSNFQDSRRVPANNVHIFEGKQVIEIRARGGYQPRRSMAKAGVPTILRFNTSGTYDCSAAVRIPRLKISKMLPPSGITDIEIGTFQAGVIQGMCGMGMYPFEIDFQK